MNSFLKKFFALSVVVLMTLVPLGVAFGTDVEDASIFEAAAITVGGEDVDVILSACGLMGFADLSGLANSAYVTKAEVTVSNDALLEVTGVDVGGGAAWTNEDVNELFIDNDLEISRDLSKTEDNILNVSDFLGALDPDADGVSMGYVRELIGNTVTIYGELDGQDVSLRLILNKFGDVNGDGAVNVQDAILILRNIVGLANLNDLQNYVADVNGDESISVQDAILVLRSIVGLVDYFDVEVAVFEDATITVAGIEKDIELEECGLNGSIDLTTSDALDYITAGAVTVTNNAILELTGFVFDVVFDESVDQDVEDMLDAFIGESLYLENGEETIFDLSEFLGDDDSGEKGVSIGLLVDMLGDKLTILGELTSEFDVTTDVSLTITLVNG